MAATARAGPTRGQEPNQFSNTDSQSEVLEWPWGRVMDPWQCRANFFIFPGKECGVESDSQSLSWCLKVKYSCFQHFIDLINSIVIKRNLCACLQLKKENVVEFPEVGSLWFYKTPFSNFDLQRQVEQHSDQVSLHFTGLASFLGTPRISVGILSHSLCSGHCLRPYIF